MATPASCVCVCVAGAAKRIRWMAGCGSYSSASFLAFSSSDLAFVVIILYLLTECLSARARTLSYIWLMTIRHKNTYQLTTAERVKACVYTDEARDSQIDHPLPSQVRFFFLLLLLLFSHDVTQLNRVNEFTNSFCSSKKCLPFFQRKKKKNLVEKTVDIPIDQVLYVRRWAHAHLLMHLPPPFYFLHFCLLCCV